MRQPETVPSVGPKRPLSAVLLPALRQLRPRRSIGRRVSQYTTDVLAEKKKLCPVLDRVLAEAIDDPGVPTAELLTLPIVLRGYLREARQVPALEFVDACLREQAAHCGVDPLQQRALVTRSAGDLAALERHLVEQLEATSELLAATTRERARVEGRAAAPGWAA